MNDALINLNEVRGAIKPKTIEELSKMSRSEIHEYVADYLYEEYGIVNAPLQHLIAILAIEIEHYAICQKNIKNEGLVVFHNGGKTQGANPYLTILNSSTKTIIRIMRELGMTPKSRLPRKNFAKPLNQSVTNFLRGIKDIK